MLDDIIFKGTYEVVPHGNSFTFPFRFRRAAERVDSDYYLLVIPQVEEIPSLGRQIKYLELRCVPKEGYGNIVKELEGATIDERRRFSAMTRVEVGSQGRINLTRDLVEFIESQEGDYFFLGCGEYCELHKMSEADLSEMISEFNY